MFVLYLYAVLPAILILLFFFFRDRFREPIKIVFITFALGFFFILPLQYLNVIFDEFGDNLQVTNFGYEVYMNYFRAGFHEELYKYLILIFYCSRHTKFNEPMDAIVYGLAVSLGFSARENIDYILNYEYYRVSSEHIAAIRIVPTIMHATSSIIMALFLSKALFTNQSVQQRLIFALLIPVLFHGTYNIVVGYNFLLGILLVLISLGYVIILYKKIRIFQFTKLEEPEIKYNPQAIVVFKSILISFIAVAFIIFILINIA
tara:strand:- start:615 stop:1397 length:783 start_codon:yes stop_codon:yes gene_type:complete